MNDKIRYSLIILFVSCCFISNAQTVNYSPAYFGPNANPVPEFTDAAIPAKTTIRLSGDYYFGFGDRTGNIVFAAEVPLLAKRVSLKVWVPMFENYKVTQAVYDERNMEGGELSGAARGGDFYVQTRILILPEKKYAPSIILNSTLKTASGTNFGQRRYFDTPGYYFDVEIGKSIHLKNKLLSEIRAVADLGFLCWETTGSTQNDAPMYGGKIILSNRLIDFENTLSGYYGWIDNGDKPLVYSSKLNFKQPNFNIFAQYQYGINDFPYHHIQLGVAFVLSKLTPKYNLSK
ncbi:hypothetical protein D0T49_09570 [Paludibacter sp. 221]|uniref:hypothetical protein n=1 Tax=Paludibacter sp. 221 TaxID=2302939 RepID=UPI0013D2A2FC|nr:hypothetical protein [Paludibacter sp. 221]NDV47292.1 hypothetical protein [Paludibacter sp. 221]